MSGDEDTDEYLPPESEVLQSFMSRVWPDIHP